MEDRKLQDPVLTPPFSGPPFYGPAFSAHPVQPWSTVREILAATLHAYLQVVQRHSFEAVFGRQRNLIVVELALNDSLIIVVVFTITGVVRLVSRFIGLGHASALQQTQYEVRHHVLRWLIGVELSTNIATRPDYAGRRAGERGKFSRAPRRLGAPPSLKNTESGLLSDLKYA